MVGHDGTRELDIAEPARDFPIGAPQRMRVQLRDLHLEPTKIARKSVSHLFFSLLDLHLLTDL